MTKVIIYNKSNLPGDREHHEIIDFLFTHLEEFGDAKEDIDLAYQYALNSASSAGGFILVAKRNDTIVGASIINRTGMTGYIPENILVYIATHKEHRGVGIASALMEMIVSVTDGGIALHVEPTNPAMALYKKFGFTNKYMEMRLNRKEVHNGVHHVEHG